MSLLDGPEWIEVDGGWFEMGGGPRDSESRDNEKPQHRVWVDAFRLARTQVTRQAYAFFLDATARPAPPFWNEAVFVGDRKPAVGPSWDDAMAYCQWASELFEESVRLPTEAEWECAALGGRPGVLYPWGDDPPESLPDYETRWLQGPEPVDAYPSLHPWGFLGLGENVHEWCSDWYDASFYEISPEKNPRGAESGRRRASRGGAWRHKVKVSRCAARSSIPPAMQYNDYGFRLASSIRW